MNLTPAQISKLDKLEKVIQIGLQTFVDVGSALGEIREEKLYLRDFDTFEAYCQSRWGWSRQRSNQLISAAELVEKLPPTLAAKVETERDARALLSLEPAEQKQVIREASKGGVPISEAAKSFSEKPVTIERNVTTTVVKGKKTEKQILDDTGYPIPAKLHEFWNRRDEIQTLMTAVSRVKSTIHNARSEDDPLFLQVNQASIDQLERTYSFLSDAKPYAVCLTCQGRACDACRVCKGTGLVSKFGYETRGNKEVREMREKTIAQMK